ncbi:unnamed protein product [Leuciscus chuanchicus]
MDVFKRRKPLTFSPTRQYGLAVISPLQKQDSRETVFADDSSSGTSSPAHSNDPFEGISFEGITFERPRYKAGIAHKDGGPRLVFSSLSLLMSVILDRESNVRGGCKRCARGKNSNGGEYLNCYRLYDPIEQRGMCAKISTGTKVLKMTTTGDTIITLQMEVITSVCLPETIVRNPSEKRKKQQSENNMDIQRERPQTTALLSHRGEATIPATVI